MAVIARVTGAVALFVILFSAAAPIPAASADLQWAELSHLPQTSPSFSVVNDPGTPSIAYVATMGSGLLRTDDGKTWHSVGASTLPKNIWRIAIDPAKGPGGPPPMYVGAAGGGFFKSLDAGQTWTVLNKGLAKGALNVRSIALGRGVILLATSDGVYKSTDGGKNWEPMGLQGDDVSSVTFAKYNPPVIVMAGIDGTRNPGSRLLGAQDLSGQWVPLKQGVPSDLVVSSIASGPVHQQDNLRTLFVAGSGGVYKSDDDGQSWAQLSGLPAQGFGALALSPADPNILYASSDGDGGSSGGVGRSTDRGGNWTGFSGGLNEKAVTALAVGRDSPATLFAVAWNPDKPAVVPYQVSDTQAQPQGSPESGLCPEGNSDCPPLAASSPGVITSFPVVLPSPCASPIITSASAGPSGSSAPSPSQSPSPAVSPSGSGSPGPSPSPTCSSNAGHNGGGGNDVPLAIALVIVGLLLLALVVRFFTVRRRSEIPDQGS